MKVRKISIFNKLFICLAILLLVGNGVLGYMIYNRSEITLFSQIQSNARNIAQCAAANISGDVFQTIDIGDEETEGYATIINELALFRDNAELEYIYTIRQISEEQFVFVVDPDKDEPAEIGDRVETTDALCKAFKNKMSTADDEAFTDEWGVHVSAYSPICVGDNVVGVTGVDISATWIEEQMAALRNLVIIFAGATYIVSLAVLGILMLGFKKSMCKLNAKVKELASGSGDLTREIDIHTGDELEVIAENMNEFLRQIRKLVKDVARSSDDINVTGEDLYKTVDDNNKIMFGMNSEIEEISANMQESSSASIVLSQNLSESAGQIETFAKDVNVIRERVQEANESAQKSSERVRSNQESALRTIRIMQEKVRKTSNDAKQIEQVRKIAEEIVSIASQTQMLSLNAQIEAARAGAMGAGFAVVATEVGHLSEDIDHAVTEINTINSKALSAVEALTEATEEMIRFITEDVVKDYEAFASLGEEYGNTTDMIRGQMVEIGGKSTEIAQNIAGINESVANIAMTISTTAEGANELAHSTKQISESFEKLKDASRKNTENSESLSEQVKKYKF